MPAPTTNIQIKLGNSMANNTSIMAIPTPKIQSTAADMSLILSDKSLSKLLNIKLFFNLLKEIKKMKEGAERKEKREVQFCKSNICPVQSFDGGLISKNPFNRAVTFVTGLLKRFEAISVGKYLLTTISIANLFILSNI